MRSWSLHRHNYTRFWFTISPEIQQPNYAQLIIEVKDKELMPEFCGRLQTALSARIPGAYVDVKQLQTNPVDHPIEILMSAAAPCAPVSVRLSIRISMGWSTGLVCSCFTST